ncbi:hypothetical protein CcCBS67573_g05215 [Chytriomyces confervae]|uniref:HNH nuclease domain-containing protein n=1 Tax=Chytriomyces confervae TaxID=246404 RepID=A0A507FB08_9FUNG|nr:hypothetical protein HDU80_007430 [Chytriomyces hyalinus]TPX73509.1 hypothetical protein CcCBS67573_g05215 [Chytriomyces confervae]
MNRHVWYLLIDESGQPAFDGADIDKVKISAEADVADVRDAVWEKIKGDLLFGGVSPVRLKVYPTKDDITAKMPLESSAPVSNEHADKNTPLFVVVPKNAPAERSVSFAVLEKWMEKLEKGLEKGLEELQEKLHADVKRIELSSAPLVEDFIRRYRYTSDKITRVSRGDGFKRTLLQYYFNIQHPVDSIRCMLSGIELPVNHVIGGHLFKECWKDSCYDRLGFQKIDDPRNGLLLFKPFEYAFDNSHICFQFSAEHGIFTMRILDPSIRALTLREYIEREDEIDNRILQSREDWLSGFQKNPRNTPERILVLMMHVDALLSLLKQRFSEFEGAGFLPLENKCYSRCLSFQAMMARRLAVEEGWISVEDDAGSPSSMWSDLEEKKKDQINTWLQTLHDVDQSRVDVDDD